MSIHDTEGERDFFEIWKVTYKLNDGYQCTQHFEDYADACVCVARRRAVPAVYSDVEVSALFVTRGKSL